ncbi:MAG: aminoglycoside phosphotransferase family protein, partial [Chloroflexota bacterium]|nr:aminoglycoside phosphotransferase family protein [Chloroflexota bacterium]
MSTRSFDPATICTRHGLVCLDDLSHRGSTSDLILRVQDVHGREYVLKQVGSELGESEVQALRAWQVSCVTPRLIMELEPGYVLIEWLEGRTMAEVPRDEPAPAVDIGQALAALHRVSPPDETPDIRSRFALTPE